MDSRNYTIGEVQSILEWTEILVTELGKAKFYDIKKTLGEESNKMIFTAYEHIQEHLQNHPNK